jgi:hypothetical protein
MFMRKSIHRRLYERQGESYRWELREKQYEIDALKRNLKDFADSFVPEIHSEFQTIPHDRLFLTIEVSGDRLRRSLPQELMVYVRDRIMERLLEFNKDFRGDMRQQDKNERLFIA